MEEPGFSKGDSLVDVFWYRTSVVSPPLDDDLTACVCFSPLFVLPQTERSDIVLDWALHLTIIGANGKVNVPGYGVLSQFFAVQEVSVTFIGPVPCVVCQSGGIFFSVVFYFRCCVWSADRMGDYCLGFEPLLFIRSGQQQSLCPLMTKRSIPSFIKACLSHLLVVFDGILQKLPRSSSANKKAKKGVEDSAEGCAAPKYGSIRSSIEGMQACISVFTSTVSMSKAFDKAQVCFVGVLFSVLSCMLPSTRLFRKCVMWRRGFMLIFPVLS